MWFYLSIFFIAASLDLGQYHDGTSTDEVILKQETTDRSWDKPEPTQSAKFLFRGIYKEKGLDGKTIVIKWKGNNILVTYLPSEAKYSHLLFCRYLEIDRELWWLIWPAGQNGSVPRKEGPSLFYKAIHDSNVFGDNQNVFMHKKIIWNQNTIAKLSDFEPINMLDFSKLICTILWLSLNSYNPTHRTCFIYALGMDKRICIDHA